MYQLADDRFTYRGMEKGLRWGTGLTIFFGAMASVLTLDYHNRSITTAIGVLAGVFALISVVSWIPYLFHRRRVRALLVMQGTQVVCMLLSLALMFLSMLYGNPFFSNHRGYVEIAYVGGALTGVVYGIVYARRRWHSRAQWLGQVAQQSEWIKGERLYNGFFETDGGNARTGRTIALWVGASVTLTPLIDHDFGENSVLIVVGGVLLATLFAMVSNLIVRSNYIRRYLGTKSLEIVE